ncbi:MULTISPECIES: hypothetical protein [unclassified Sphingomonas]|uniref:hypothetical protein n=1 Tax=unclassified Sphingomonas TaxID=196159 RepID=UPI00226A7425|nr:MULTISPECIES: hypothetical protein [unclassified Sphingomonas]
MPRTILAIRDPGSPDHVSFHDDEAEARAELAAYVRRQPPRGRAVHPLDDGEAVTAWFGDQRAKYAIGKVTVPPTVGPSS